MGMHDKSATKHYRLRSLWVLSAVITFSGCTSLNTSRTDYDLQEVFYLTTREAEESKLPEDTYNGERGNPQSGIAMVVIDPRDSFSQYAHAYPNRVLKQTGLVNSRTIQDVRPLQDEAFMGGINSYFTETNDEQDILLFIHGYRKDFEDNLTRAAHLRHELAFPGPVIVFSWPSRNTVAGYMADRENIEWATPYLKQLIQGIATRFPSKKIHLVAHSLGNLALFKTVIDLHESRYFGDNWPIGELVLLAPDYDREIFLNETASILAAVPSRVSLYVSSDDIPLMASAQVFHYPRLGDSRVGPPVFDGIETIDVSDAVNVTAGHGYYEASKETIEDLHWLINRGIGAADRPTLKSDQTENGQFYWRLVPTRSPTE